MTGSVPASNIIILSMTVFFDSDKSSFISKRKKDWLDHQDIMHW